MCSVSESNLAPESIKAQVIVIGLGELIMNSNMLSVALPVILAMATSGGASMAFAQQGHDYRGTFEQDKRDGYDRRFRHRRNQFPRHGNRYQYDEPDWDYHDDPDWWDYPDEPGDC